MLNCLDPDQDRHFVSPDLGPNCLQGCQQMTKVSASRERVNNLLEIASDYFFPMTKCLHLTKGPRVQASQALLCCVLEQDTYILA